MLSRKKTEADLAVEILLEHQEPMYYETLLKEIAQRMGRDQQISTLVPIYSFKPGPSPTIPGRWLLVWILKE